MIELRVSKDGRVRGLSVHWSGVVDLREGLWSECMIQVAPGTRFKLAKRTGDVAKDCRLWSCQVAAENGDVAKKLGPYSGMCYFTFPEKR